MSETKDKYPANHGQSRLKRVGDAVRKRLDGNPSAYKVDAEGIEMFAFANFMSPAECEKMMALIDAVAKPSSVFEGDYTEGYRTSYSGDVDPTDPFVKKISRRIDDLLDIDPTYGEAIQGQRYMPGQEFKPHHDWFHPNTGYWDREMARGGQRSYTTMVFLNKPEAGGKTEFCELGLAFEPTPGVLLAWNNTNPDGLVNRRTLHAGRPVVSGAKYIITRWYRAERWF